ncbi:MAG: monovalent cation/H(+) antiporter subunit G [Actinobacteria bacterium]|nr:monovalent cation/H(+) antiporter subunit G [Actinomycetota bacterium]
MIRDIAADVLLGLAAAIVIISSAGLLVMRDAYQKLHFTGPPALVSPVLVTLAVWLHVGNTATTLEAMLALLLVVIAAPFLSHATIRAARIRDTGDWRGNGRS